MLGKCLGGELLLRSEGLDHVEVHPIRLQEFLAE